VTTSIASVGQWPVAGGENAARLEPGIAVEAKPGGRRSRLRNILGLLDDAMLLLLVVLLFPLLILLIGTPVALLVRLLIEIAHRL
jgi:hypothetical protein